MTHCSTYTAKWSLMKTSHCPAFRWGLRMLQGMSQVRAWSQTLLFSQDRSRSCSPFQSLYRVSALTRLELKMVMTLEKVFC